MILRSRTVAPIYPNLFVVERVTELKVLDVVLDITFSFESHILSIADPASSNLVIIRKVFCLFVDLVLVLKCFWIELPSELIIAGR